MWPLGSKGVLIILSGQSPGTSPKRIQWFVYNGRRLLYVPGGRGRGSEGARRGGVGIFGGFFGAPRERVSKATGKCQGGASPSSLLLLNEFPSRQKGVKQAWGSYQISLTLANSREKTKPGPCSQKETITARRRVCQGGGGRVARSKRQNRL